MKGCQLLEGKPVGARLAEPYHQLILATSSAQPHKGRKCVPIKAQVALHKCSTNRTHLRPCCSRQMTTAQSGNIPFRSCCPAGPRCQRQGMGRPLLGIIERTFCFTSATMAPLCNMF
ncbi:hypothetical protein HPB50_008556 [Hyalomma asiaticum]|uniref:Uncharacterized protein n=1 Tax=Hyalomma asiaticum TaxID=266040 RepID=A0ACB7RWB0_HYAAI|nr:hypothetical protein HPB50_008556 [Hyalomma asiaticum]